MALEIIEGRFNAESYLPPTIWMFNFPLKTSTVVNGKGYFSFLSWERDLFGILDVLVCIYIVKTAFFQLDE